MTAALAAAVLVVTLRLLWTAAYRAGFADGRGQGWAAGHMQATRAAGDRLERVIRPRGGR